MLERIDARFSDLTYQFTPVSSLFETKAHSVKKELSQTLAGSPELIAEFWLLKSASFAARIPESLIETFIVEPLQAAKFYANKLKYSKELARPQVNS